LPSGMILGAGVKKVDSTGCLTSFQRRNTSTICSMDFRTFALQDSRRGDCQHTAHWIPVSWNRCVSSILLVYSCNELSITIFVQFNSFLQPLRALVRSPTTKVRLFRYFPKFYNHIYCYETVSIAPPRRYNRYTVCAPTTPLQTLFGCHYSFRTVELAIVFSILLYAHCCITYNR
jgi:hypothetical protein